jgi:hypothetical protein
MPRPSHDAAAEIRAGLAWIRQRYGPPPRRRDRFAGRIAAALHAAAARIEPAPGGLDKIRARTRFTAPGGLAGQPTERLPRGRRPGWHRRARRTP